MEEKEREATEAAPAVLTNEATGADEAEELLEVSAADAATLAGRGSAASPATMVEQRTGATVAVEKLSTKCQVRVQGNKASVAKALTLLRALVSFREAASAEEQGYCRWFASGFCSLAVEGAEGCEDGLHSIEHCKKMKDSWLEAGSAKRSPEAARGTPLLLALSCRGGGLGPPGQPGSQSASSPQGGIGRPDEELLEMALTAFCPQDHVELGRFHRIVKPLSWELEEESMRKRFPASCFHACEATNFTDLLADLLDWLSELIAAELDDLQPELFLFVTCRDWEMQTMLPRLCNLPEPGSVDVALQSFLFSRWCCLKDVFRSHFSLPNEAAPAHLRAMLRHLGLPLLDQVRRSPCMDENDSIGRVVLELLKSDWQPIPTAWRDTVSSPTQYLLPSRGDTSSGAAGRASLMLPAKRGWTAVSQEVEVRSFTLSAPTWQTGATPPVMVPPPGAPPGVAERTTRAKAGPAPEFIGLEAPAAEDSAVLD